MSLDSDDCLGDDLTNPRRVVAMSRGIVGLFTSIDYPCMTGLIEKTAGLTVYEADEAQCISPGGVPSIRMPHPALRSWR